MSITSTVTDYSILTSIRNSYSWISKGVFREKPRPGLYGRNLDHAIERLAKKMEVPSMVIRARVIKMMAKNLVAYVSDRLIVVNSKIASVTRVKMSPPMLNLVRDVPSVVDEGIENLVIDIPRDGSSATNYEAVDATYGAWVFDDLDLAYASVNPFTRKAYESELRANLATG